MKSSSSAFALAALPRRSALRDVALISAGVIITAIAANIEIPWRPVPFTFQTLAVMLCGLGLGARLGFWTQVTYLGAGALGAPVFAGGGGVAKLMGPTGGYLVAFVATATLLGWLADLGKTKTVLGAAIALFMGAVLTLALGAFWLSAFIGVAAAFRLGFLQFLPIEMAKAVAAIPVAPIAWKLVQHNRKGFEDDKES